MCRSQCLLFVTALTFAVAHSWDVAVTTPDQIQFYTNQTKTRSEGAQFRGLTAIAYDAVNNMLLFVDKQNDNASIFSFHLATKKYQALVRKGKSDNIQGIAFDPVNSLLFWTDVVEKSIFWISLKSGFEKKNDLYGNLLMKMEDEIPRGIAVDSCRGYIYWTNTNVRKPTIERAKFDGTGKEVVIDTDIELPVSIAVDQRTKRLYWADDREGIHYSIESSDLDGGNRKTLLKSVNHMPNAMSVSKDSIYWVDLSYRILWRIAKNTNPEVKPEEYVSLSTASFGVVANYSIEDQIENVPECEALRYLSLNKTSINDSFSLPPDMGLFCVHGVKVEGKLVCKCSAGYTGDRCDISVCRNYCFQGDCSVATDGQPQCRCKEGYIGKRCETNACYGYCLNNGVCTLNEHQHPHCQCSFDYEGSRCETLIPITTTVAPTTAANDNSTSNITCDCSITHNVTKPEYISDSMSAAEEIFCNDGWDPVRDSVIAFLVCVVVAMFGACFILLNKLKQLKMRPRIKKRIIVNKNITPMTSRPDQCEITIENCCNMNICETPCFEPRSTIRPTLLGAKSSKEEKNNLLANMECPDNY